MATTTRPPTQPAPRDRRGSGLSRIKGTAEEGNSSRVRTDIALTFDDVLLVPGHSITHPRDVDTSSRFTRSIELRIPLVSAAMTRDRLVTAPVGTTLDEAEEILAKHRIEKLPVVDESGTLRGLITVKDIHKRRQFPDANKDQYGRLRVAAAIGSTGDFIVRAKALIDAGVDAIVIDTAHGHSEAVLDATSDIRERFPEVQLIAGNIATREGAR